MNEWMRPPKKNPSMDEYSDLKLGFGMALYRGSWIWSTSSLYRVDRTEYYQVLHTTASNRADHVHVTFFTFWTWGFGGFFFFSVGEFCVGDYIILLTLLGYRIWWLFASLKHRSGPVDALFYSSALFSHWSILLDDGVVTSWFYDQKCSSISHRDPS